MKTAIVGLLLGWACGGAWAQTAEDVPSDIRQQRALLGQERARITELHKQQATACWQKFAVNDCLTAVRKSQHVQLDPIHQKELQLNAQERAWRTQQREERLQNKAADGGHRER